MLQARARMISGNTGDCILTFGTQNVNVLGSPNNWVDIPNYAHAGGDIVITLSTTTGKCMIDYFYLRKI